MTSFIYTVSQERFGFEEKNWIEKQSIPQPNRLQRQIKEIRQRVRVLRKQYNKTTSNIEKIGLQHLRDKERQHLTNITKAENIRKKRRATSKMRSPFTANPFRFTKSLLEEEKLGKPDCSMEDIASHLQQTHGDGQRDIPLGECTRIEPVSAPEMEMETLEPTWKVMKERLDLDQLQDPTGFHTQCIRCVPKAASQIMNPFNSSLEEGPIPACWQVTEAMFTPKENVARDIVHFRKISLLNMEGNIFFSALAKRLIKFMTENNYVDTSVQKGGI